MFTPVFYELNTFDTQGTNHPGDYLVPVPTPIDESWVKTITFKYNQQERNRKYCVVISQ